MQFRVHENDEEVYGKRAIDLMHERNIPTRSSIIQPPVPPGMNPTFIQRTTTPPSPPSASPFQSNSQFDVLNRRLSQLEQAAQRESSPRASSRTPLGVPMGNANAPSRPGPVDPDNVMNRIVSNLDNARIGVYMTHICTPILCNYTV
jgi:hypothetical protein